MVAPQQNEIEVAAEGYRIKCRRGLKRIRIKALIHNYSGINTLAAYGRAGPIVALVSEPVPTGYLFQSGVQFKFVDFEYKPAYQGDGTGSDFLMEQVTLDHFFRPGDPKSEDCTILVSYLNNSGQGVAFQLKALTFEEFE